MTLHARNFFLAACVLVFSGLGFTACTYEPDVCKLTVTVKDVNDTTKVISKAQIHVGKENGSVVRDAVSDEFGQAHFEFPLEAVLDVIARYRYVTYYNDGADSLEHIRMGKTTVRLEEGKHLYKIVLLQNEE